MNHIALDLELEQPKTNPNCKDSHLYEAKIIQVGYVVYSLDGFEILSTRCNNINIGVPISEYIRKLTGISNEDIEVGTELHHVCRKLVLDRDKFCASRIIKQWGGGDFEALKLECSTIGEIFGRSGCNIKHMYQIYAEANGIKPFGGLKKSCNRVGIGFEGKAHNALTDAINTARMHNFIFNKLKN